ncbi:RNA-binding protein 44 isoform X2 [Mobula hypostoma]|uniref:RNA-binding protein 44 isoform X2 n=1 Tax=Mobula hypostoma TaxID=723540 RepID=UPI002FC33560
MDLMEENGDVSNLSLDAEFEMYRKLSKISLQEASSDYFQEFDQKTLHQYIPEYKDSATSNTLYMEPSPGHHSTESHYFFDFDYLSHGEISPEVPSPTGYALESFQLAHCSDPAEDVDETSFLSAVTSTQQSFVLENIGTSASQPVKNGVLLVECKSTGIPEQNNDSVFSDSNTEVSNGSKSEPVNSRNNRDLKNEVLLETAHQNAQCFPFQTAEMESDQPVSSTSTKIETDSQVPLELLNVRSAISVNAVSRIQDTLQNQGERRQNNTVSICVDSDQRWEKSCELLNSSDQLNLLEDSFVSAVGDSIIASTMVGECCPDRTVQMNDAFRSLRMTGDNNKSTKCVHRTPDTTPSRSTTMFQSTCIETQVKCDCTFSKDTSDLIMKVDQTVDAGTDFRADFTMDKATTATISVVDRANNTDIILMSKNRPTLGQNKTHGTVACNTKWSIGESIMKHQSTQTVMVSTEEKCTNTVSQLTEFNISEKELVNNRCKPKLKKVPGELEELKKLSKSIGLKHQGSVFHSVTKDGNYSSDCCCYMKQRVMKAELQLLKMQYWMCRQHCWRIHSVDIEQSIFGDLGFPGFEVDTDNATALSSALQELKDNYENIRKKVLEGISLDSLPLLSVELRSLPHATFVPATLGEKSPSSQDQSCLNHRNEVALIEELPCEDLASKNCGEDDKPGERLEELRCDLNQHVSDKADSVCEETVNQAKDLEVTGDWFDAEENFVSPGDPEPTEGKVNDQGGAVAAVGEPRSKECVHADISVEKETAQTSYIYIDGLPTIVTEVELKRLFQKYQVSGVGFGNLHNDYRNDIIQALKEVKANNKGFLSGLALTTIVELASAILKLRLSSNTKE